MVTLSSSTMTGDGLNRSKHKDSTSIIPQPRQEILDLKFAGVPILLGAISFNGRHASREWQKDRQMARDVEKAQPKFTDTHEWKPNR